MGLDPAAAKHGRLSAGQCLGYKLDALFFFSLKGMNNWGETWLLYVGVVLAAEPREAELRGWLFTLVLREL